MFLHCAFVCIVAAALAGCAAPSASINWPNQRWESRYSVEQRESVLPVPAVPVAAEPDRLRRIEERLAIVDEELRRRPVIRQERRLLLPQYYVR